MLFSLLDFISVVTTSLSVREIWGSRPGPVNSDTVSLATRRRCFISSNFKAVLPGLGAKRRKWAPPLVTRFGGIP